MFYDNLLPNAEGGGGEEKKAPSGFPLEKYSAFGHLANTFKDQGWTPENWNNDYTEFRPRYGLLSSINLPNKEMGYLSIKGGNKNGVMDLNIKDKSGKVVHTLLKGVDVNTINDYFTNTTHKNDYGQPVGSMVNQRSNQIQSGNGGMFNSLF